MVDMTVLVGSVRRFGLQGPPYEVLGPVDAAPGGEPHMRICLVQSGEIVEYPLAEILRDPEED